MKLEQLKNLRAFIFPFLLIIFCIFWIIRLEIKASALEDRVDEYHEMLEKNHDELQGVTNFWRTINDLETYISMSSGDIHFQTRESVVYLDNKSIYIGGTKGNIDIELLTMESELLVGKKKILIQSGVTTPIEIIHGSSKVTFENGEINLEDGSSYINLKNDFIKLRTLKELELNAGILHANEIKVKNEEITLQVWGGNKITLDMNNIWIDSDKQITLNAKEGVNIISEDGNVDIFGKKINFNEL